MIIIIIIIILRTMIVVLIIKCEILMKGQIFSIFIAERFIVLLMQLMKFQFLSVFKTFPGKF